MSVLALLRIGVGVLFLLAGACKGADVGKFEGEIRLYNILPVFGIPYLAAVIVAFEIVAGSAFIIGKGVREAASVLSVLCACFSIALIVRIVEGVSGDCGCFGGIIPETIGPGAVARDVFLLFACIAIGTEQGTQR